MINKERLLDYFLGLISIDSESGNEKAMSEKMAEDMKNLGAEVSFEAGPEYYNTNGKSVVAVFGRDSEREPILLSAHMDTVVPGIGIKPIIKEDGFIYSDGSTILAADDKCGIAIIVEAIKSVLESGKNLRPVEIVFSVGEEQGLYGAKAIDTSKLRSKMGYILDTGGKPGKIARTQPGQYRVNVTIHGKKAHAGNQPEAGVSAIQAACRAIAKMELLRVDPETTSNVGEIHSQFPTNIVPDICSFKFEVRSRNGEKLEKTERSMYKAVKDSCDELGASFNYEREQVYASYFIDDNAPVIQEFKKSLDKFAVPMSLEGVGGGSDANVYNQKGIQCVAIANGQYLAHSPAEKLNIEEMNLVCELLADMLTR